MEDESYIVERNDPLLITGATGFIGSRVVLSLLNLGFRNLRCFVRPSSDVSKLKSLSSFGTRVNIMRGNLLSPEDCAAAAKDVAVVFHLAAGTGTKSYPGAYANSVVTTRNLLEAIAGSPALRRFVNISSFSVYANRHKPSGRILDEKCPVEPKPVLRGNAYCYAKAKQDDIVAEYGNKYGFPYVVVRPGYVYGPGREAISSRIGIGTFGIFLHLGGSNRIPLTYVDNCADAIALAGLKKLGADHEVFNVVDDDLPSSRKFLRLYKKHVRRFNSIYVPHFMSYALSYLWERYSTWSENQLEPVYNRYEWHAHWKKTRYSNRKLKDQLGWKPQVSMGEGLRRYFESCRSGGSHA